MFTTPIEGEGKPREREVKTMITIVESNCCCFERDQPQINIASLEWDESTTNLHGINFQFERHLLNETKFQVSLPIF